MGSISRRSLALLLSAALAAGCGDAATDDPPAAPTSEAPSSGTNSAEGTAANGATGADAAESGDAGPGGAGDASEGTDTGVPSTTTEASREWTLLAGGDVLMDRTEPRGIDPFRLLDPQFDSADLAMVNIEMAISNRGRAANKRFVFRAPLSAAARIAAAGIDVGNLANNHAKDYGTDALIDTVEWLEAAGVTTIGAGANADDAYRHRVLSTDAGVRVAFLGASQIVPYGFPAGDATAGIASANSASRARVLDSVRAAAADADAVVVSVHWGVEVATCPSTVQQTLARELLDAGADAVIGHHPHVLQPVAFADGKLVAYSLGNFVWHPRTGLTGDTGVLQVDFDGGDVVGWVFHPHLIDADGAPEPAESSDRTNRDYHVDRIRDIVTGDCARHARAAPTTTAPTTTLPPPTGTAGTPA